MVYDKNEIIRQLESSDQLGQLGKKMLKSFKNTLRFSQNALVAYNLIQKIKKKIEFDGIVFLDQVDLTDEEEDMFESCGRVSAVHRVYMNIWGYSNLVKKSEEKI